KAGSRSNGVTVRPDGKRVYVSSGGEGSVQVIDTATNAIIASIPVGKRPWNMAITPDGRKLYVACGRSNAVAVIDTDTNTKIADIPVADLPWGVGFRCFERPRWGVARAVDRRRAERGQCPRRQPGRGFRVAVAHGDRNDAVARAWNGAQGCSRERAELRSPRPPQAASARAHRLPGTQRQQRGRGG